jgi:thioredoxin-related protein
MRKTILLTVFPLLMCMLFSFQTKQHTENKINWISLEQAFEKNKTKPKKIIIDVYTGWCGWCKVMDQKTFSNQEIVKYINENYYAVKLDAETKSEIKIGQNVFKYDEQSRANNAAITLLQGKMTYPSIVYLDESFNMIQPIPGYMEAPEFHKVITFMGENAYKSTPFDTYKETTYKTKFKNSIINL